MDSGWFLLGAAAVGGAIGLTGPLLADRFRWRRHLRTRWDESRLDAYAAFEGAVLHSRTPTAWITVGGARRVAESGNQMLKMLAHAYARVNLLATDEVKDAADALAAAAKQDIESLSSSVKPWRPIPAPLPEDRDLEVRRLRVEFERAARRERDED